MSTEHYFPNAAVAGNMNLLQVKEAVEVYEYDSDGTKSYRIGMRAYSSSSQTFGYRIRIFDISRHMPIFAFGYHNRSGKNTRGDNLEYMNLNYRDTIISCFLGLK